MYKVNKMEKLNTEPENEQALSGRSSAETSEHLCSHDCCGCGRNGKQGRKYSAVYYLLPAFVIILLAILITIIR